MNREDCFNNRENALEHIIDSYYGLIEGDPSIWEEPLQDESTEEEIYGDITEARQRGRK